MTSHLNKILLLSMGDAFFKGALWGAYDCKVPLNVACLAAYLEGQGLAVDVLDLQVAGPPEDSLRSVRWADYACVGLNASLGNVYNVYELAGLIKKRTQLPVFSFGVQTVLREVQLRECPHLDASAYGEEELTVHELCNAFISGSPLSDVSGVIWRNGADIVTNPARTVELDLDSLPFPAFEKFDVSKYQPSPGKFLKRPQFQMITSRGCRWRCFFCSNLRGKAMRFRSPENIVAEIDHLQARHGAREIEFVDDTFTADRDRAMRFVELMRARKEPIVFRICSRVDQVDPELLAALKSVGLYSVGYGMESGVDSILELNRKDITTAQIRAAVDMTKAAGLEVRGFFMINLPGDTGDTIGRTESFIKELDLDLLNVQITYPWPGTALREHVRANYEVDEELWDKWDRCDGDDIVFLQPGLDKEYISATYRRIIRDFYLRPRFVLRWLKRIRTWYDLKYSICQAYALFANSVLGSLRQTK